jgi:recombination protein RecR
VNASLRRAIELFTRLPGVGEKTAQRYLLHLLTSDPRTAEELGRTLSELHTRFKPCAECGHIAEVAVPEKDPICSICSDSRRDPLLLCVVARTQDVLALEKPQVFRGRYFVLGRLLSPLEGIGPESLPLPKLLARIARDSVREVILATPPSVDGEATALFLRRELGAVHGTVSVTRIASGIPHGGDLEYADPITLGRALDGRRAV